MPFSFKPEVSSTTDTQAGQVAPPSAFASSTNSVTDSRAPANDMMERTKEKGKSFFEVVLITIFSGLVITLIGLLAYKYYLSSQIDSKKAVLASYETRLDGIPLEDMRKLSNRLKVINDLVKNHPSVNVAFLIVEASVENPITFNKFDLHYSQTAKSYELTLLGLAPDYKSVAQQLDTYRRKPYSSYVSDVKVDDLHPNETGQIALSFTMPVSITGILPETFSLLDSSMGTGSISTSTPESPTLGATTSPIGNASTTAQAQMP